MLEAQVNFIQMHKAENRINYVIDKHQKMVMWTID